MAFWVFTPHNIVIGMFQGFGETCWVHHQADWIWFKWEPQLLAEMTFLRQQKLSFKLD